MEWITNRQPNTGSILTTCICGFRFLNKHRMKSCGSCELQCISGCWDWGTAIGFLTVIFHSLFCCCLLPLKAWNRNRVVSTWTVWSVHKPCGQCMCRLTQQHQQNQHQPKIGPRAEPSAASGKTRSDGRLPLPLPDYRSASQITASPSEITAAPSQITASPSQNTNSNNRKTGKKQVDDRRPVW